MNPSSFRRKQDRDRERERHESEIAQCAGCGAQIRKRLDGVWVGRCRCTSEEGRTMKRWTIYYPVDAVAVGEVEGATEAEARAAFDRGEWTFSHYAEELPGDITRIFAADEEG